MALKDLLVCLDQTEAAVTRLRLAADLARRHGSRLTALFVRELSQDQSEMRKNAELGLASGNDFDRVTQLIQRLIDDTTERLRAMIEDLGRQHGLEIEWRDLDGTASGVASEEARYADLCILGPGNPARRRLGWVSIHRTAAVRDRAPAGVRSGIRGVQIARAAYRHRMECRVAPPPARSAIRCP